MRRVTLFEVRFRCKKCRNIAIYNKKEKMAKCTGCEATWSIPILHRILVNLPLVYIDGGDVND